MPLPLMPYFIPFNDTFYSLHSLANFVSVEELKSNAAKLFFGQVKKDVTGNSSLQSISKPSFIILAFAKIQ